MRTRFSAIVCLHNHLQRWRLGVILEITMDKIQKICTFCEESFPLDVIKDHIRIKHLGFESSNDDAESKSLEQEIKEELIANLDTKRCNMCNIGFPNRSYLRKHLENFHLIKQNIQESEAETSDYSDTESEQSLDDYDIEEELESSDDLQPEHEVKEDLEPSDDQQLKEILQELESSDDLRLEHEIQDGLESSDDRQLEHEIKEELESSDDHRLEQEIEGDLEDILDIKDTNPDPKCDICLKEFKNLVGLRTHMRTIHDQVYEYIPDLTCVICNKEFLYAGDLNRHKKVAHEPKDERCEVCGKFYSKYGMRKHKQQAHNTKVKCDICDKELVPSALATHKENVHDIKEMNPELKCDICQKEFKKISGLRSHMRAKHDQENIPNFISSFKESCEVCGMTFYSPSGLQSHKKQKNHQTPKPPKPKIRKIEEKTNCDICNKEFPSLQRMKSHKKRVHSDFRVNCDQCDKSFKCKSSLRDHVRKIHDETYVKELYYCEHCEKPYASRDYLEKHSCKPSFVNFNTNVCRMCNIGFPERLYLRKHLENFHRIKQKIRENEKLAPDFSDTESLDEYEIQEELESSDDHPKRKQKSYTCGECKKSCSTKEYLLNHLCISNMVTYECGDCLKVFSSEAGLKVHQRNFHKEYCITAL